MKIDKKRKRHGNSIDHNNSPHHLYEIRDIQENDIFKYGISQDPIESDGLSKRLRDQINLFNVVAGFIRFLLAFSSKIFLPEKMRLKKKRIIFRITKEKMEGSLEEIESINCKFHLF